MAINWHFFMPLSTQMYKWASLAINETQRRWTNSSTRLWNLNRWCRPTRSGRQVLGEGRRIQFGVWRTGLFRGKTPGDTLAKVWTSVVAGCGSGTGRIIVTLACTARVDITRLVRTAFQDTVAIWRHLLELKINNKSATYKSNNMLIRSTLWAQPS